MSGMESLQCCLDCTQSCPANPHPIGCPSSLRMELEDSVLLPVAWVSETIPNPNGPGFCFSTFKFWGLRIEDFQDIITNGFPFPAPPGYPLYYRFIDLIREGRVSFYTNAPDVYGHLGVLFGEQDPEAENPDFVCRMYVTLLCNPGCVETGTRWQATVEIAYGLVEEDNYVITIPFYKFAPISNASCIPPQIVVTQARYDNGNFDPCESGPPFLPQTVSNGDPGCPPINAYIPPDYQRIPYLIFRAI